MKFIFLEPFYGGSHKDFTQGLIRYSRHSIDLFTMPARFWKWRMRGAALYFHKKIPSLSGYDGIIVTDLMSLADFKALYKEKFPPVLVYFHENQFSYPLFPGEVMDYQYSFTNITTALSADRVLFNSRAHYEAFFSHLPAFLNMMPEYHCLWAVSRIKEKTGILYPGCHFPYQKTNLIKDTPSPPAIIWNHRWEHDKNPDMFFHALGILKKKVKFNLLLLGEQTRTIPDVFASAKKLYGRVILQYGYVDSREKYYDWLKKGSVVVSTARQENFGIAVVEAIRFGNIPLVPNRLSYPEIIPSKYHNSLLYNDEEELIDKLEYFITHAHSAEELRNSLAESMAVFSWEHMIGRYDRELENLALQT
ncbi:MAG: DUF3524 domain-containing protein [Spirochaetales bacterium]|nr:DUF3524 domain-containing protein [Spirochaetales bacterium]